MGKKGKKKTKKDIWDLTAEEQKELLEESNAYTSGDIFGLVKYPKMNLTDACVSPELENIIANDLLGRQKESAETICSELPYRRATEEENESITPVTVEKVKPTMKAKKESQDYSHSIKPIRYCINRALNRIVLNDGISPTTLSLDNIEYANISDEYLNNPKYNDDLGEILTLLGLYIVSCKHPIAILTDMEFVKYFNNIESMNTNKFIIMSHSENEDLFMLYYLDHESEANFLKLIVELDLDSSDALRMIVSMAYAAGEYHNIFLVNDESYVKKYREYTHNEIEKYIELVYNDPETVINNDAEEDRDDNISRLSVIDYKELQTDARNLMIEMADDDEEPDDDDEEEEPDVNDDTEDDNESGFTYVEEYDNVKESISEAATTIDPEVDFPDIDLTYDPILTESNQEKSNTNSGFIMEKITR